MHLDYTPCNQKGSPRSTRVEAGFAPILIVLLIAAGIGGYFVYTSLRGVPSLSRDDVAIYPTPIPISSPSPTVADETAKPTSSPSSNYTCPQTEYINCMPPLPDEKINLCNPNYLDWAKANCPNFKGAAY